MQKIIMNVLIIVAVLVVVGFLSGCVTTTVNDTYAGYGNPNTLMKNRAETDTGFYYTRSVGDATNPDVTWTGSTDNVFDFFILDYGLELRHRPHGNYYRVHFYPIFNPTLDNVSPWVKVALHDQRNNPIVLFAKLPEDRTLDNTGALTTDWFSCDSCTKGKEQRFITLANSSNRYTDQHTYKFRSAPKITPNWQGDLAAKEQQLAAEDQRLADEKQRTLEALEANLPPEVLRDKYMIQLSKHLKKQDYQSALTIFPRLEALPVATDPSLKFFFGEALLKTGQPAKALPKLYQYVNEQGNAARHYTRALELINQAESQL